VGKKGVLHCTKSRYVSVQARTVDGNRENQHSAHKYLTHGRYGISFERCNYSWFRNVRATNKVKNLFADLILHLLLYSCAAYCIVATRQLWDRGFLFAIQYLQYEFKLLHCSQEQANVERMDRNSEKKRNTENR